MRGWIYDGPHGFRSGYSCENQVVTVCQDIVDSLDEGVTTDAIIMDFTKAFDFVPHDRLLTEIATAGVDFSIVIGEKEFLVGRSLRLRLYGQLTEEDRGNSRVPLGYVFGPLLFLAYINDVWRNISSNIRLFADGCVICRKIMDSSGIDKLQTDLNRLWEWAAENEMKINPEKLKQ